MAELIVVDNTGTMRSSARATASGYFFMIEVWLRFELRHLIIYAAHSFHPCVGRFVDGLAAALGPSWNQEHRAAGLSDHVVDSAVVQVAAFNPDGGRSQDQQVRMHFLRQRSEGRGEVARGDEMFDRQRVRLVEGS